MLDIGSDMTQYVEKHVCPTCGAKNDALTDIELSGAQPKENDVTVCLYCSNFQIFTGQGLATRAPTDDEREELLTDDRMIKAVLATRIWQVKHGPLDY